MTDPSDLSASSVDAARELRVTVSRLRRRIRAVAGTHELTPSQTSALSRLLHDGPAGASDLAAAEGVRPQSMATTIAALEERGMVERTPDPGDGRRRLVSASDAARAWVAGHRRVREEWLAVVFEERFTEDERRTVLEALALLERVAAR